MPNVMQVSSPIALTPTTIVQSASMSRSFGSRQAAPMQHRPDPAAFASAAAARTASTSINFSALSLVFVAGMVPAMDRLRFVEEVQQRQIEQRPDFLADPVSPDLVLLRKREPSTMVRLGFCFLRSAMGQHVTHSAASSSGGMLW